MDLTYRYKRLDLGTDAIRLIRVLKGDKGPIECEMFETYINKVEGVPYEAVSYVWGNKVSADKIWVDGHLFTVTQNLFEALSNLRQSGEDRLLWIDAICIDQSHPAVSDKSQYMECTSFHSIAHSTFDGEQSCYTMSNLAILIIFCIRNEVIKLARCVVSMKMLTMS